ncbi:MAG TPA: polyketide synthase, partial [candidate division Zixibacteria bacterium]|nr:polyketide synthase [candidate division Zixibacteria bacterium]
MSNDPIAIIGIGCRYPGNITSPQTFWDFISHGRDAVQHIPKERKTLWSVWGYEHDYPEYGGFVDPIDHFDAAFFQISPREAKHIDPQQRLLLELAWEALEDAGMPTEHLSGRPIGVFIGIFLDEYWDLQRYTDSSLIDVHTNTGGTMSIAANRISYAFDFKGPSLSVDTACSSSLTAIHLACRSLYNNECEVALAGGVNLILTPQTTRGFNKARMLSPDGRCRAFDSGANGY